MRGKIPQKLGRKKQSKGRTKNIALPSGPGKNPEDVKEYEEMLLKVAQTEECLAGNEGPLLSGSSVIFARFSQIF